MTALFGKTTSSLRIKLLASVFLAASLPLLGGCSYTKNLTYSLTDRERTVPDTGMTPMTARRAPVLNPGGALFRANTDLESQKIVSENPYLNEGIKSVDREAKRGDYAGDAAPDAPVAMASAAAPSAGWSGNVFTREAGAAGETRRMPPENIQMMQQPPTMMTAPVPPVASAEPLPSVTPPTALPPVSVPEKYAQANDEYPVLSATPPAPAPLPPSQNYDARMQNMLAERELAENMRRELLTNPEPMTSAPPAMALAEPGTVTPPVAPPAATTPKPDPEFSNWLKRMFDEENKSDAKIHMSERRPVPSRPMPSDMTAPQPLPGEQAAMEPIQLRPPSGMEPPLEPIELTPPAPGVAGESFPNGVAGQSMEPIHLQPPAAMPDRNVRFLADNRYSARRAGIRSSYAR